MIEFSSKIMTDDVSNRTEDSLIFENRMKTGLSYQTAVTTRNAAIKTTINYDYKEKWYMSIPILG